MCNILHPLRVEELAKSWLLEDTSNFNFGGGIVDSRECEFNIYMKSEGTLAGIPFANAVFTQLSLKPEWFYNDGDWISPITVVAKIAGSADKLLLAERIVLNILSRASGVATKTTKMYAKLMRTGWKGILAGSRKTTPGFRMVEKYALLIGGADMHRYDLSSMVMLKDNHLAISGSVQEVRSWKLWRRGILDIPTGTLTGRIFRYPCMAVLAINKARKLCGFSLKIEVECQNLKEANAAANANCDIIMLDNLEPEELQKTALTLKLQYPNILLEASGGITEENILDYACPWIDIISSSSLIQGYPTLDFSMKVKRDENAVLTSVQNVIELH